MIVNIFYANIPKQLHIYPTLHLVLFLALPRFYQFLKDKITKQIQISVYLYWLTISAVFSLGGTPSAALRLRELIKLSNANQRASVRSYHVSMGINRYATNMNILTLSKVKFISLFPNGRELTHSRMIITI